jgi:hypothetical protein
MKVAIAVLAVVVIYPNLGRSQVCLSPASLGPEVGHAYGIEDCKLDDCASA